MVGKSVVTMDGLSTNQILDLLHKAEYIDSHRKEIAHTCDGRVLATLFYEPSTRTRLSFETAMLRLGGKVIGFAGAQLASVTKGESIADTLKTVAVTVLHPEDDDHEGPWREVIAVALPGDRQVDMKRLEAQFAPAELEESTEDDLKAHPEMVAGYMGPMVFGKQGEAAGVAEPVRFFIDAHVAEGTEWIIGGDEAGKHRFHAVYGRDFKADGTVEAVEVRHGDMSPDGSGPLSFERGVEIGQVFQLGLKYSKALDLKVLDQNGKAVPVWMGCYGIGVSRVLACIAETHHDEAGLAWPSVIAPAAVHVVATGKDAVAFEGAEKLVAELEAKGLEVIYDDRKKVSPGVKFKDAELIGVPLVAVVGRDYVNDGTIELRDRNGENKVAVPAAEAADALAERFAALS